jgi:hypothetical protein
MLHVLQDMGSPSHVRDDYAAHQEQLSEDPRDRGSRFERVAALAFGRLGIPSPRKAPALASLSAHFANTEGSGLANVIERSYFSDFTLPRTAKVLRDAGSDEVRSAVEASLRRPEPASPRRIDIIAAKNDDGATWVNDEGVCLARYHWKKSRLSWSLDDDCRLEQLEAILPTVAGYGVSFLDTLFPGDLELSTRGGQLRVGARPKHYADGTVRFFADAADGTRSEYHSASLAANAGDLASAPLPPRGSVRVTVLVDGHSSAGEPIVATTTSPWPLPSDEK